jgi:hypothetical protein
VSHRAAGARRKRNVLRQIWTQENCGPRKEIAASGRRMGHSIKVARHRGHNRKRYNQDNVVKKPGKDDVREKTLEGPGIK